MAVPARPESASDPGPAEPDPAGPRQPDMLLTQLILIRAAVQELARRPGDEAALETARLNLAMGEKLAALFRREVFGEQLLERERKRAYDEGVAACRAARCRLKAVPG